MNSNSKREYKNLKAYHQNMSYKEKYLKDFKDAKHW